MKLIFSESQSDYEHFIFPYVVWAFPEAGETPELFFKKGFLPSSRNLDRFYMCRQLRVDLSRFSPSSENRRIMRKSEGIVGRVVSRGDYNYTAERREFFKTYADARFGPNKMSYERLDLLMSSPVISHLLSFEDSTTGREVGTVLLYKSDPEVVFYYFAFYDLAYTGRNLGMYMMTWAVSYFSRLAKGESIQESAPQDGELLSRATSSVRRGGHIYLGTCYSNLALYKTQFAGIEFFTGYCWSENLQELKFRIGRELRPRAEHLLEDTDMAQFYPGNVATNCAALSFFKL